MKTEYFPIFPSNFQLCLFSKSNVLLQHRFAVSSSWLPLTASICVNSRHPHPYFYIYNKANRWRIISTLFTVAMLQYLGLLKSLGHFNCVIRAQPKQQLPFPKNMDTDETAQYNWNIYWVLNLWQEGLDCWSFALKKLKFEPNNWCPLEMKAWDSLWF